MVLGDMSRPRDSHAYKTCSAQPLDLLLARTLLPHQPDQIRHLQRGKRRFPALVAGLAAGAVERLLQIFRSEHAEYHRHAGLHTDFRETLRSTTRHVIEVRRIAAYDAPDRDDRVIAVARGV